MSTIDKIRKIANEHQAASVDGFLVDAFSASAVVQVYDALNPTNRAKFEALAVGPMVALTWKLVG